MKKVLLLIATIWCCFSLQAEDGKSIKLDHDSWEKMVENVHYETGEVKPIKKHEWPKLMDWSAGDLSFLKPFLFGGIIILIVVVLIIILRNSMSGESPGKKRTMAESIEEAEENLPEVELDDIYKKAVLQNDFKSALRVKFLMVLQRLIDARLIVWKKRKTNEQYIVEIRDPEVRIPFAGIVRIFDDTWYGNNMLSKTVFDETSQNIDLFNRKIPGYERQ